jgi:hypothetical protein
VPNYPRQPSCQIWELKPNPRILKGFFGAENVVLRRINARPLTGMNKDGQKCVRGAQTRLRMRFADD